MNISRAENESQHDFESLVRPGKIGRYCNRAESPLDPCDSSGRTAFDHCDLARLRTLERLPRVTHVATICPTWMSSRLLSECTIGSVAYS